jgi:hypothetical protein
MRVGEGHVCKALGVPRPVRVIGRTELMGGLQAPGRQFSRVRDLDRRSLHNVGCGVRADLGSDEQGPAGAALDCFVGAAAGAVTRWRTGWRGRACRCRNQGGLDRTGRCWQFEGVRLALWHSSFVLSALRRPSQVGRVSGSSERDGGGASSR